MNAKSIVSSSPNALRVAILAAGKDAVTANGRPLVLENLGGKSILETVLANVRQVVSAAEIYIVVGRKQDEVRTVLGEAFHYVLQQEPLGTGDAVLQVARHCSGPTRFAAC